jgi:hypothetical protein
MNRILIALFATALLCGNLLAHAQQSPSSGTTPPEPQQPAAEQQQPAAEPQQPAASQTPTASAPATESAAPASNSPKIAPGSVLPAQLTKSIDAKKAKKGDEVVATITQDLRNNAGTVVVPKDTKIVGHVTEAEARNKEQKESQVAIAFDHAVMKNGEQMQMPISIQAIIAAPNRNPANAGGEQPSSYPGSGTGSAPTGGGRAGSMSGTAPAPSSPPQTSGSAPTGTSAGSQAQQPITGDTQGVVGIANLKLSPAPDPAQGSVISSEKNNVKLDDGTFLLLRVNQ